MLRINFTLHSQTAEQRSVLSFSMILVVYVNCVLLLFILRQGPVARRKLGDPDDGNDEKKIIGYYLFISIIPAYNKNFNRFKFMPSSSSRKKDEKNFSVYFLMIYFGWKELRNYKAREIIIVCVVVVVVVKVVNPRK